jgi:hypothetical protein
MKKSFQNVSVLSPNSNEKKTDILQALQRFVVSCTCDFATVSEEACSHVVVTVHNLLTVDN